MGLRQFSSRTLITDIKRPDRDDFVSPELDSHRVARRNRKDVEEAATYCELPHFFDQRYPFESSIFQQLGKVTERHFGADSKGRPKIGKPRRNRGPLL